MPNLYKVNFFSKEPIFDEAQKVFFDLLTQDSIIEIIHLFDV